MEHSDLNQPMILPLMDSGEDFTYSNFLSGDDSLYPVIGEAAGSTSALSDAGDLGIASAASPVAALSARNSLQKQRLERRGHTKSRRGCFNCKRRRIKVFELHLFLEISANIEGNSVKKLGRHVGIASRQD